MKIFSTLFILFISTNLYAFTFNKGDGSKFNLKTQGQNVSLSIYIAEVSDHKMNVEFHFGSAGVLGANMWQQFGMGLKGSGPIEVKEGYVQLGPTKKSEIMTPEMFQVNNGVRVEDFLFNNSAGIEKDYIGDEKVEIPAGSIVAKHYRKVKNGQTIDFWIADKVKPIGLVKLISKSETVKTNNYTIELTTLLRNVKATIDPKKAVKASKETQETFTKRK